MQHTSKMMNQCLIILTLPTSNPCKQENKEPPALPFGIELGMVLA